MTPPLVLCLCASHLVFLLVGAWIYYAAGARRSPLPPLPGILRAKAPAPSPTDEEPPPRKIARL